MPGQLVSAYASAFRRWEMALAEVAALARCRMALAKEDESRARAGGEDRRSSLLPCWTDGHDECRLSYGNRLTTQSVCTTRVSDRQHVRTSARPHVRASMVFISSLLWTLFPFDYIQVAFPGPMSPHEIGRSSSGDLPHKVAFLGRLLGLEA